MKCPTCKVWTFCLETRTRADGTKRRRYECANTHRFSTDERPVTNDQNTKGKAK